MVVWSEGLDCNRKSVVMATRGGGLGPRRHDSTPPLPVYTTLAPAFSPNVSRNEKEGPKTKTDSLEHFLPIDPRREGPKTKSGSLEHFLRIDLRGEGRGEAPQRPGAAGDSPPNLLTGTAHTYTVHKTNTDACSFTGGRLVCRGSMIHFSMIVSMVFVREDSEGTWGGAEDRPKRRGERRVTRKKKQKTPMRQSRGRQQGQTGHGRNQEARQGARERRTPLGKEAGRQGPTPQRTGGGWGGKSPQKTLVRYPTSGVWGPPRCPYRPHLSAGNKVGYARDRWPAARGGTGLGGWPMGLTKSTPHGTYCGSCPVRGCG